MKERIAIIHGPLVMGGAEKSLINLLRLIDYSKYEVTLWLKDGSGALRDQVDSRVTVRYWGDYIRVPYKRVLKRFTAKKNYGAVFGSLFNRTLSKLYVADWYKNYKHFLKSLGKMDDQVYDVAISYHSLVREDLMILSYLIKSKTKIGWIHGACRHDKNNAYYKPYQIEYTKLDRIICVSESTEKIFLSLYPELNIKTSVIYNLQNTDEIKALAEEEVEESFSEKVFTTVGRLSKEKGQDMIPAIAAELLQKGISFKWYIVGEGELRDEIERNIRQFEVRETVILLGEKKNPYPYIKNCSLYIQPSHTEGYCLTTLEAKVLNKPVVITDVPGMREQFRDGMAVYCEDTVESLVKGIEYAVSQQIRPETTEEYWSSFNDRELGKFYSILEG